MPPEALTSAPRRRLGGDWLALQRGLPLRHRRGYVSDGSVPGGGQADAGCRAIAPHGAGVPRPSVFGLTSFHLLRGASGGDADFPRPGLSGNQVPAGSGAVEGRIPRGPDHGVKGGGKTYHWGRLSRRSSPMLPRSVSPPHGPPHRRSTGAGGDAPRSPTMTCQSCAEKAHEASAAKKQGGVPPHPDRRIRKGSEQTSQGRAYSCPHRPLSGRFR